MSYPSLLQHLMQDEGAGTRLKSEVLPNLYAVCETAPSTEVKTVDVHDFVLTKGATVYVEFTNKDTAGSCSLNVSDTGDKPILVNGVAIVAGLLNEGKVYQFIYDGTAWVLVNDNNVMHLTTDETIHGNKTFTGSVSGNIDASSINSGVLSLDRIPKGAIETLVTVVDQAARYALTPDEVQLGDTVRQYDTGVLYVVVDEAKLDCADGYVEYKSGISMKLGAETIGNQVTPIYLTEGTATLGSEYVPRSGGEFTGNLSVTGDTSITGKLSVANETTLQDKITVTSGGASVTGDTSISGELSVFEETTLDDKLTITSGGASVTGDTSITGKLSVANETTLQDKLTVTSGGASVTGDTSVTGNLSLSKELSVGEKLSVTGETTLGDKLTVTSGGANVTGDISTTGKVVTHINNSTHTDTNVHIMLAANMSNNDCFFIGTQSTEPDSGAGVIATLDNGTEPIYVRQYLKTDYDANTPTREAVLLDKDGNSSFPGNVVATGYIKGSRFAASNGTNKNIDFQIDGISTGGFYIPGDKAVEGTWLPLASESYANGIIPSGTRMFFQQSSAPTGWTKDTSYNNYALRLVSGNVGGRTDGSAFSTIFDSGRGSSWSTQSGSITVASHTLTIDQIPSHRHYILGGGKEDGCCGSATAENHIGGGHYDGCNCSAVDEPWGWPTAWVGGSKGHTHTASFTGSSHNHTVDMKVNYIDVILCVKN